MPLACSGPGLRRAWPISLILLLAACSGDGGSSGDAAVTGVVDAAVDAAIDAAMPLPPGQQPIIPRGSKRGAARGRLLQSPNPGFGDPDLPLAGGMAWAGAMVEARSLAGP